jgi:hypothetical protein
VGRGGLRDFVVQFRLDGVNHVREFDGVLDEEDRDVVADEVEVSLLCVELGGEAAHVAREVGRAARARDGREAHEDGRLHLRVLQEVGLRQLCQRLVDLKVAVRARAACMHHALGDALVVEVRDLLAEDEVFEQRRAALAVLERILVVVDAHALIGRQVLALVFDRVRDQVGYLLVCFPPILLLPAFTH